MSELNSKLVAELVAVAKQLNAIVQFIQAETPQADKQVAEEVAKKVANRICLACGRQVPKGESYRRGLDTAHYNHALRLIKEKEATEAGLMADGQLAPVGKTGKKRPKSSLDSIGKKER